MSKDYRYQPQHLSDEDREVVRHLAELLNSGGYEAGLQLVYQRLKEESSNDEKAGAELTFLLAGFLVDFGTDLNRPEVVREGVAIFEEQRLAIEEILGVYSIEYCLGNAKYGLYGQAAREQKLEFRPKNIQLLTEAKNHFWRALRSVESSGGRPEPQIYVNLGNCLDSSGRVIEAIRQYDRALEINPMFGMAHLNRAMALDTLNQMSDTYSINMILQQRRHYQIAANDKGIASQHRDAARSMADKLTIILEKHSVPETTQEHHEHVAAEIEAASAFRRFSIRHKLALNEHALYCQCVGAQSDSLRIPKATGPIGGAFVPAMELLLNRVRVEFSLARMLYFRHDHDTIETTGYEAEYSELFNNEQLGIGTEMLRTSFRLCFGILDRIAFALCALFDLASSGDQIYFESFWRRPRPKSPTEADRWERINEIDNWGLVALYSQASDLNRSDGEWAFYKEWRNKLEHEALILTTSGEIDLGPWVRSATEGWLTTVEISRFKRETLHLLQITAAAIFYFVYCVRAEGKKALGEGEAITTVIDRRWRDGDSSPTAEA